MTICPCGNRVEFERFTFCLVCRSAVYDEQVAREPQPVWQQRGLVLVPAETVEPRAGRVQPWQPPEIARNYIACACGARADEKCRTVNGTKRHDHPYRVVSKRCPCSQPVARFAQLCDSCRREVRRTRARQRPAPVVRHCTCGAVVPRGAVSFCTDCAAERIAESKRQSKRRRRQEQCA